MRRAPFALALLMALVGCHFPVNAPSTSRGDVPGVVGQQLPVSALKGRVDFGAFGVQASVPDVAAGATVSLIDTASGQTASTALTDAAGDFVLTFPNGFTANPSATYYLEAVRGLGAQEPGQDALRVRTVIKYADGWTSLTNTTPNAGIVVSPSTTALAIAAALRNGRPDPLNLALLIGALTGTDRDVYAPVAGVSAGDFVAVRTLVDDCLSDDRDPVAGIGLALPGTWRRLDQTLGVTALDRATGPAGSVVTLSGTGFDPDPAQNLVAFNGLEAPVSAATSRRLTTAVPLGATSGQLTVQVANLVALGPLFTVPVTVSAFSPASGRQGAVVTVTGAGFSPKLWENLVTFSGVPGTVTRATPTELCVAVPATQTGTLTVSVNGQSADAGSFVYEAPMLAAITPAVERAGRMITLEGNFGPSAVVNFPGGVSVPATGGANRLRVTVPEGATQGDLTVTVDGQVTNARAFRRAPAELGIEQFTRALPQASGARSLPKLATTRGYHTLEVIGDYLYAIGGRGASGALSSVERARIYPDGTFSAFTDAGVTLGTAREKHASVVLGGYLYVLGGRNTAALASIERAPINADGTLGAFQSAGSLNAAREGLACQVAGNRLHVIGGKGAAELASVESTIVSADGSLGAFQTAEVALGTARAGHTSHVLRDHLYVVAGRGQAGLLASVERAPILPDGRLGAFTTLGAVLSAARENHQALVLGDTLTVVGGGVSPGAERAKIRQDGDLGGFQGLVGSGLPPFLKGMASAIVGNAAYLVGGDDRGTYQSSLLRGPFDVNASGAIPRFETIGYTPFPTLRREAPSAVVGDWLYVFAGLDEKNLAIWTVLRARLNRDGTLGPFEAAPATQGVGLGLRTIAVLDQDVYLDEEYRARIASEGGDLQDVLASGYTWPTARAEGPTSVWLAGRLLQIGGTLDTVNLDSATVAADGTLGSVGTPGYRLSTTRRQHLSAVVGNHLYVFGGSGPANEYIERAAIDANTGNLSGNFLPIEVGKDALGHPEHMRTGGSFAAVIGNSLYMFETDGAERIRVSPSGAVTMPERVPFALMAPSGVNMCHTVGDVLHFVGERGVESVRIR